MQDQVPETLEVSLEQVKAKIELAELLDQLHRSPAFKKIIKKGYFEDRAKHLVSLTALPQDERQKAIVANGMIGISALQQYFHSIYREGEAAANSVAEHEAYIEEEKSNG
jgi:hypothetical protein